MQHPQKIRFVTGPDGYPLTMANLPEATTSRWVPRRKAEVIAAVKGGLLTLEQACDRYSLSVDEYLSWQASYDAGGLKGLRRAPRKPKFPEKEGYIGLGAASASGASNGTVSESIANTASSNSLRSPPVG